MAASESENRASNSGAELVEVEALDWEYEYGKPPKTNLREMLVAIADADDDGLKAVERLSVHDVAQLASRHITGLGSGPGIERARGEALAGYRTPENPRDCIADPPREGCPGPDRDGIPCFSCWKENPDRPPTSETAVTADESVESGVEGGSGDETPRVKGDRTASKRGDSGDSGDTDESDEYRDRDEYLYVPAAGWEGASRKMPPKGYKWVDDCPDGVDPRSAENPYTKTYDETTPDEPYIMVGAVDGYILDIDVDIGDEHETTFDGDVEDIETPDGATAFLSATKGPHRLLKFDRDHPGIKGVAGVDVQGDLTDSHGVITSPYHHPEYEITAEPTERVTFDVVIEDEKASLNNGFGIDLLEQEAPAEGGKSVSDRVASGDFETPDEAPEERPACYHAALMTRQNGGANNNHDMNVCIGALGLAAGYSVENILDHIQNLDDDVVGFDRKQTRYGLKHLRDGGYSPPATETLAEVGICGPGCEPSCPIHVPGVGDKKRSTNAPGDGDGYEKMPMWALRNVAYDAGHDPEDDVWRDASTGRAIAETVDGAIEINEETDATVYRALPVRIHNLTLDILEEVGRENDHGREPRMITDDAPILGLD